MIFFKLKNNFRQGFTLVEILIVIGVIVILTSIMSVSILNFKNKQALENSTNMIISTLNDARAKTLASVNNNQYGVHIQNDKVVIFTGGTYSSSTISNENFFYESPVSMTALSLNGGGSDIKFDRLKGSTSQYGTITIALPGSTSRNITVASTGTIQRN